MDALQLDAVLIVGTLALAGWLGWLLFARARDRARELERRNRLLEQQVVRFAEAGEFIEFLSSPEGRAWMGAEREAMRPRVGLVALVLTGILACGIGGGLLANAFRLAEAIDPDQRTAYLDAAWWGSVLLGCGVGALTAAVALARLARSWGLLPPNGNDRARR